MHLDFSIDFTDEEINHIKGLSTKERNELLKQCSDYEILANMNQINRKLLINSLYGALGNIYFRYYDLRNATAITLFGQLAIQWSARKMDEYLNKLCKTEGIEYVFYIDTDSNYVELKTLVEDVVGIEKFSSTEKIVDFLAKFASEKLEPLLSDAFEELKDYMNNYQQKMFMDREAIAMAPLGSKGCGGFWKAKKRYALNVYDMEGTRYNPPKLKIMGLETQQSSTPKAVQEALVEAIRISLQEGEESLQEFYSKFEKEYRNINYRQIAFVSTANNIEKYNDNGYPGKKCPVHVRAVLTYKRAIKGTNITDIQEGEKVMVLPLKPQNPFHDKVIAWPSGTDLPDELRDRVLANIDYATLFEKTFKSPLQGFCDATGFEYDPKASLFDLFGI